MLCACRLLQAGWHTGCYSWSTQAQHGERELDAGSCAPWHAPSCTALFLTLRGSPSVSCTRVVQCRCLQHTQQFRNAHAMGSAQACAWHDDPCMCTWLQPAALPLLCVLSLQQVAWSLWAAVSSVEGCSGVRLQQSAWQTPHAAAHSGPRRAQHTNRPACPWPL